MVQDKSGKHLKVGSAVTARGPFWPIHGVIDRVDRRKQLVRVVIIRTDGCTTVNRRWFNPKNLARIGSLHKD